MPSSADDRADLASPPLGCVEIGRHLAASRGVHIWPNVPDDAFELVLLAFVRMLDDLPGAYVDRAFEHWLDHETDRPRPVQICQHALDARRAARERLGLDRAPEPEPAPAGPRAPLTGEALAQHNAALRRLPPAMLARIAPELLAPIEPMTDDAGSEP